MTGIIIWAGIITAAIFLFRFIIGGRAFSRRTGIAHLTVFHDLQPKDKQEAIEIIVEQKAGKNWVERENGLDVDNNG